MSGVALILHILLCKYDLRKRNLNALSAQFAVDKIKSVSRDKLLGSRPQYLTFPKGGSFTVFYVSFKEALYETYA